MITLEAYRASIGKFSAKANHTQLCNAQSNYETIFSYLTHPF